jgi:IS30 family transposase
MDPVVRRRVFDLLFAGCTATQAAAAVGVSVQLVCKWRGRVGGVIPAPVKSCDRFLDRDERYEIARLREQGLSMRAVAARVGRDPATVSRELARNAAARTGRYEPERAHAIAVRRRRRPKRRKLAGDERLRGWAQQRLNEGYSPEQVAGRLPVEFPHDGSMRISHETIYQALYVRAAGQLRRELRAHLRTGRTQRRRRGSRSTRLGSIQGGASIHDRPEEVADRLVPGHWEGDLIMGSMVSNSAVGTLVERRTGYLSLLHLPDGHGADAVADAVINTAAGLPPVLAARSITWDRGQEMAGHARITATTGVKVYFADPYSPWQRGSNENVNGLLREYLPKGSDLSLHTAADLDTIAERLNNRPRKRLAFHTPHEAMTTLIKQDQQARCCDDR